MEKIKAIKSVRIKGKPIGGGGFTAATLQENERPNKVRETFSLQGIPRRPRMTAQRGGRSSRSVATKIRTDGEVDLLICFWTRLSMARWWTTKKKETRSSSWATTKSMSDDALRLKVTL